MNSLSRLFVRSFLAPLILVGLGCGETSVFVHIENESELNREDEVVTIPLETLQERIPATNPESYVLIDGTNFIPSQIIDLDGSGSQDALLFVTDLAGKEAKSLRIVESDGQETQYPRRTQAELSHKFGGEWQDREYVGGDFRNVDYIRVPDEHTDHSLYFRYEGPGWESDKVGYRFYLDWRNATDIFGKKTSGMVLQEVGLDGYDSYHEMADWGMDILQVGQSLGIGSIAMWHDNKVFRVSETDSITCRITANGPVFSQIRTRYFGWKVGDSEYDLTSNLSITPGSRKTRHDIMIDGNPANLCTGLVKHRNAGLMVSEAKLGWRYLANYGRQSLANDNLGMAILFRESDLIEITEDEISHVVVLKPQAGELSYYFLAAWAKEPNGIINKAEFLAYLESEIAALNNPVKISLN